ncbi:hypothetical protein NOS3756_59620 (plasmid) [Nostoc sp. NIES-3756]|uniref:hypothetical protein n=1 Tax=Nostoc sp. NIES-3756 TaxID=1751286 RepID=UPI000720DEE1|nr:hypothetical protein [Nostoc sp. NIES-3756]BAT56950.1 hypothetical protein NOS3756_59620 [Nostoc sp. NIES-3756]
MSKAKNNRNNLTAGNLLNSLRCRGGSAPLHSLGFSRGVIQSLLDKNLVKVQNTGRGFFLQIIDQT